MSNRKRNHTPGQNSRVRTNNKNTGEILRPHQKRCKIRILRPQQDRACQTENEITPQGRIPRFVTAQTTKIQARILRPHQKRSEIFPWGVIPKYGYSGHSKIRHVKPKIEVMDTPTRTITRSKISPPRTSHHHGHSPSR